MFLELLRWTRANGCDQIRTPELTRQPAATYGSIANTDRQSITVVLLDQCTFSTEGYSIL